MVRRPRKAKLVQISLTFTVFLVSWALLVIVGSLFLDIDEIRRWLADRTWIALANPRIRDALLQYAWQSLFALMLAILSYRRLEAIASRITRRFLGEDPPLVLKLVPTAVGISKPESLLFLPGDALSCALVIENVSLAGIEVNRVVLKVSVYRTLTTKTGKHVLMPVPALRLDSEPEAGLQWTRTDDGSWLIGDPFTLRQDEEMELPMIHPTYDEEDSEAVTAIRELVGVSTLSMGFDVTVHTSHGLVTSELSAPLRIFRPLEDGDDGGIDALINALTDGKESDIDSVRKGYEQARRWDFEVRGQIAGTMNEVNEVLEIEHIETLRAELDSYDHAVAMHPADPVTHRARADFLYKNGIYGQALESLDRAIDLGLDDGKIRLTRAKILAAFHRSEDALTEVDIALHAQPEDATAHMLRGKLLQHLGRVQDALTSFDRALELDPNLAEAHCDRGFALINTRADEALAAFNRAIQLAPDSPMGYFGRAVCLAGEASDDEVLASIEQALQRGWTDMWPIRKLAPLLGAEGKAKLRMLDSQ
ncbi:tetratricopeptide repeat protein [Streptomyces sp. 7N604]|uniref:tetratricopeptide repeat protein n=1 Tax=Streptomyces sp. 7N604 TaxID=3457415 RepID=UPI003FD2D5F9